MPGVVGVTRLPFAIVGVRRLVRFAAVIARPGHTTCTLCGTNFFLMGIFFVFIVILHILRTAEVCWPQSVGLSAILQARLLAHKASDIYMLSHLRLALDNAIDVGGGILVELDSMIRTLL